MAEALSLSANRKRSPPPLDLTQEETHEPLSHSETLIVIEPREFVRGCVVCWLGSLWRDFSVVAIPKVEIPAQTQAIKQALAGLVCVSSVYADQNWLTEQVMCLRAERSQLPIIMVVEPDEITRVDALVHHLGVQGYIPTSSTVAVAAAVLRLVIAGGTYFPAESGGVHHSQADDTDMRRPASFGVRSARLTPREEAVLGVLASGAQNKIIAYQLGMSLSTVKAHVHSIINKLDVRNRTEAVVAARDMLVPSRAEPEDRALALVTEGTMQGAAD